MYCFKFKIGFLLSLMLFLPLFSGQFIIKDYNSVVAYNSIQISSSEKIFVIYDENGDYLFEREEVDVGDEFIDKNKNVYEVVFVDRNAKVGKAEYRYTYKMPKLRQKKEMSVQASVNVFNRGTIGMYMTHNDESYISGDGYDSVYGKGGIHDIAKSIASCFNAQNVKAVLDETLHIPHDTSAYLRSAQTAKRLLANNNLDAIFDIHRDGASRGYYVTKVDGVERCMVRMVVGKANANYEANRGFALYLMSVAEIYCPWLFVDIYMAKGHYNQALMETAMLFEFGSHLVEKDLVLATVPDFASLISVALFGEFVEEEIDARVQLPPNDTQTDIGVQDSGNINEQTQSNEDSEIVGVVPNQSSGTTNNQQVNNENEFSPIDNQNQISNGENVDGVKGLNQNDENAIGATTNTSAGKQENIAIVIIVVLLLVGYVCLIAFNKRKNK